MLIISKYNLFNLVSLYHFSCFKQKDLNIKNNLLNFLLKVLIITVFIRENNLIYNLKVNFFIYTAVLILEKTKYYYKVKV